MTRNATGTKIFNCNSDMCAEIFVKVFFMVYSTGHESKDADFSEKSQIRPKKGTHKKITKWPNKQRNIKKMEKLLTVFEKSVFMHVTSARMKPVFVKKNFEKAAEYCQWWILVLFPTFKIVLQRLSWKPFLKTTSNYMTLLFCYLIVN